MIKYLERNYRLDIKKWQTEILLFGFITVYIYSIWANGKDRKTYSLCKKSSKAEAIFVFNEPGKLRIGQAEFKEKYKGNKWTTPLNRVLDLNLP